ncbi:MGR3 Mitochondrial inner membrane i-AAA protease supercomplex subunit MGR3 [Candida maltosa Xu316]
MSTARLLLRTRPVLKRQPRKYITPNTHLIKRGYSQYNYDYSQTYPPIPPKTPFWKKVAYVTLGLSVLGGYAYYMWWPKHTFPSSIAKILRKGLWAESDRGEYDYQLALKHYLEALEHANEIGLDPLSDEYTGIQLKIGEMFERLNMLTDAAFIYNEIAALYLTVLTSPPDSENGKRILNRQHRRHLIQKDLRIALKLVSMNANNPQFARAILLTHLIIAQDEVNKSLGRGMTPEKLNISSRLKPGASNANSSHMALLENDEIVIKNSVTGEEEARIKKTPEVWEPFTDEFFNAMDLLSAMCISAGDLAMATRVKTAMNESMMLADIEPSKMLMSQCNLGSLLYMQAEELEAQELSMKRKFAELSGVDYAELKQKENSDQELISQKLKDVISVQDQEKFANITESRSICLKLAVKSYESVLQFAKSFPQDFVKDHNEISETVALATYGLGVINLHLSQYDKAERLLRESRVRAKSCDYDMLLPMIETELDKLFNERKAGGKKFSDDGENKVSEIEMDIVLK